MLHLFIGFCILGEHDQLEMRELHESLPDLHVTARRVSRSINGDKKKKGN